MLCVFYVWLCRCCILFCSVLKRCMYCVLCCSSKSIQEFCCFSNIMTALYGNELESSLVVPIMIKGFQQVCQKRKHFPNTFSCYFVLGVWTHCFINFNYFRSFQKLPRLKIKVRGGYMLIANSVCRKQYTDTDLYGHKWDPNLCSFTHTSVTTLALESIIMHWDLM